MKNNAPRANKIEQDRINTMKPLGCVACALLGVPNLSYLELNHMLSGGVRMGHWYSYFLCRGHHQGDWSEGQLDWIEPDERVAISDGRKRFNAVYGTERSLWEKVQKKLKLPMVWPVSKIVPRRDHVAMDQNRVALLPGAAGLSEALPRGACGGTADVSPGTPADRGDPGRAS